MPDFKKLFRDAIAQVIVKNGEAFDHNKESWGDSRGTRVYDVQKHMEMCSVESMTNFNENYSWSTYDTINNDSTYGVSGVITCACSTVKDITFIVDDVNMSTIMAWLLQED